MPKDLNAKFLDDDKLNADFIDAEQINATFGEVIKVTTGDYEELSNKPKINNVEVIGSKDGEEYKLQNKMDEITEQEIDNIIFGG